MTEKWISNKNSDYSSWRRVENPKGLPEEQLPYIYVFINGWMAGPIGQAVSADGMGLGSHACSAECWIYNDLGIAPDSRPDRHETYLKYYPDGYILQYIPDFELDKHEGFQKALKCAELLCEKKQAEKEQ
jgi:hypothetical protein